MAGTSCDRLMPLGDWRATSGPDGARAAPRQERPRHAQHDPGIVLLFRATRAIDLGAVPGPTQDVPAVPVPGGQQLLLSVAT